MDMMAICPSPTNHVSLNPFKGSEKVFLLSTVKVSKMGLRSRKQVQHRITGHLGIEIMVMEIVTQVGIWKEMEILVDLWKGNKEVKAFVAVGGCSPNEKQSIRLERTKKREREIAEEAKSAPRKENRRA